MLIKSLPRIAAKILKNTWGVPPQFKQKLELVREAYGQGAVEEDFENWCKESTEKNPRYPVTEYLKVIDSRLGSAPKQDEADPRIEEISALTYKLTHRPAPPKNVRELLTQYNSFEITEALREYVEGIEDRELPYAARTFFVDGGCGAIISARKSREKDRQDQIERDKNEKKLIENLVEKERIKSEEDDQVREAKKAEPSPTAEELFGAAEPKQ